MHVRDADLMLFGAVCYLYKEGRWFGKSASKFTSDAMAAHQVTLMSLKSHELLQLDIVASHFRCAGALCGLRQRHSAGLGTIYGPISTFDLDCSSFRASLCGYALETQRVLDLHKRDSSYKLTSFLLNTNSWKIRIACSKINLVFDLCLLLLGNIDARNFHRSISRWAEPPTGPPHQKARGGGGSPDLRFVAWRTGEEDLPIPVNSWRDKPPAKARRNLWECGVGRCYKPTRTISLASTEPYPKILFFDTHLSSSR
jgi:hypothetical protein